MPTLYHSVKLQKNKNLRVQPVVVCRNGRNYYYTLRYSSTLLSVFVYYILEVKYSEPWGSTGGSVSNMECSFVTNTQNTVPIGSNEKCCWVCRSKDLTLNLFPRIVGYYCFKGHRGYLQDLENTMWKAGTPYNRDIEPGIQMKWMCKDCSSTME